MANQKVCMMDDSLEKLLEDRIDTSASSNTD